MFIIKIVSPRSRITSAASVGPRGADSRVFHTLAASIALTAHVDVHAANYNVHVDANFDVARLRFVNVIMRFVRDDAKILEIGTILVCTEAELYNTRLSVFDMLRVLANCTHLQSSSYFVYSLDSLN